MSSAQLVRCIFASSLVLLLLPWGALTEPVDADSTGGRFTYDQRQTGKYNIHVSIKDVAIIEMDQNEIEDDSFGDYDYYYDEEDLTVKPIRLTSASTTSMSTAGNHGSTSVYHTTSGTTLTANVATAPTVTGNNDDPFTEIVDSSLPTTNEPSINNIASVINNSVRNVTVHNISGELRGRSNDILVQHQPSAKMAPLRVNSPPAVHTAHKPFEQQSKTARHSTDSKIYKFKVRRTHKQQHEPAHGTTYAANVHTRRCRSNQYRDISGNCRIKRSSSFLKKLFSMLVSLPFADERIHDSD